MPASRTPEGSQNHCLICNTSFRLEPSQPPGDAPCPACGHLVWFLPAEWSPPQLSSGDCTLPFKDKLAQVMDQLEPLDRKIIELCLKGCSKAEVATELGVLDRKVRRVFERARGMIAAS